MISLHAGIRQSRPEGDDGSADLEVDTVTVTSNDYPSAYEAAAAAVPQGWNLIHITVDR